MTTITEDIVTRIAECFREIETIETAYDGPPSMPIEDANLPAAVVMVGAIRSNEPLRNGGARVTRTFPVRVFIAAIEQGTDAGYLGDSKYGEGVPVLDHVYKYFVNHKNLSTNATPDGLAGVLKIQLSDSGISGGEAPGGARYWVINFALTVITVIQYCNPF